MVVTLTHICKYKTRNEFNKSKMIAEISEYFNGVYETQLKYESSFYY